MLFIDNISPLNRYIDGKDKLNVGTLPLLFYIRTQYLNLLIISIVNYCNNDESRS